MLVTKADGTKEQFRPEKLRASLKRAGAQKSEIEYVVNEINKWLPKTTTTQEIYKRAFRLLNQNSGRPTAARYSLKKALFALGPTGFLFEDFLARLFESEGYVTKKRIMVKGKCATHEIDIAAYKPDDSLVAEAKFHTRPGINSDLKVAMYSYARMLDLKAHSVCKEDTCGITSLYVITNTKFSSSAIEYCECTGVKLLSWNYPSNNSLRHRIEKARFFPITALTTLSQAQKAVLLQKGDILCRDVFTKPNKLRAIGLSSKKITATLDEIKLLYGSN